MTATAPQLPAFAVALLLIVVAGTQKRALEWKARRPLLRARGARLPLPLVAWSPGGRSY